MDDVSKVTLPAWPGQGNGRHLVIFRTLSPFVFLSVLGCYFRFLLVFGSLYCILLYLGSLESLLYIYVLLWLCRELL